MKITSAANNIHMIVARRITFFKDVRCIKIYPDNSKEEINIASGTVLNPTTKKRPYNNGFLFYFDDYILQVPNEALREMREDVFSY